MLAGLKRMFTRTKANDDMPWDTFTEDAKEHTKHTPDALFLQRHAWQLLFVYNECQKGQHAFEQLGDHAEKLSAAFTQDKNFVMLKKELGKESYPFAIPIEADQMFGKSSYLGQPAKIVGQLFKIRSYDLIELDNYMLNTVEFNRIRVTIEIPSSNRQGGKLFSDPFVTVMDAHMYVGNKEYWQPLLDAGSKFKQVKLYHTNAAHEEYYFFNDKLEAV